MTRAIDKGQIARDLARSQKAESRATIAAARKEAKDARAACGVARRRAIETCAGAKSSRVKRNALIALAHEYRLIRRAELSRERAARKERGRRGPSVARAESDDEVRHNIPPELVPTWQAHKGAIGRHARKSRTETFLEWVESHPAEIVFVEPSADEYEASFAQRRASNPGGLVALGWLSDLELADGRHVRIPRRTLVAYDPTKKTGGLVLVFGARTSRKRPPAKMLAEYKRTHWGKAGNWGISTGDAPAVPSGARGREIARIVYATTKGADTALVDYDHPFEETLPSYFKCSGSSFQIHGGSYRVTERGIVG